MNKWEKEVTQSLLDSEKETLDALEQQYAKALRDIGDKVKQFEYDIARLDDALQEEGIDDTERGLLESRKRAKVYQKTYQEALQGQVSGIVDKLHADEYKTIDEYLQTSYDDSFIGELYNLQKQGVPVVFPIDQKAAVRAILTNSKLSAGLYARLGIDLQQMKADVSREITRGIASSMTYKDIARNIKNVSGVSMGRAKTIARTEGHRIQEESRQEVRLKAREIGADQVKQWDSALDAKTRDSHVKLDGQIREIDEPFEVDGKKAMHPGEFGRPEEDCNCRCRSNTRARWALSANETKHLGNVEEMSLSQKQAIADKLKVPVDELDKYSGQIVPIKAKDYEDFKRQYGEYWHYEGSDLQKEAEARIAGYKTKGKTEKASGKMAANAEKTERVEKAARPEKTGNMGNISSNPLENSAKSGKIKADRIVSGHASTPKKANPNEVIDHQNADGKVDTRSFYGSDGMKEKDIHTTNHGNPKTHNYGSHGEHAHDYAWNEDGSLKTKTTRNLSEEERERNSDIL